MASPSPAYCIRYQCADGTSKCTSIETEDIYITSHKSHLVWQDIVYAQLLKIGVLDRMDQLPLVIITETSASMPAPPRP